MWPAFTPTFLCRAIFRGYAEIFIFRRYIHLWYLENRDWCWSNSCHLRPETIAHSSTSSLRRLPLSRIPSATNGIPSKCASDGISGKLEPAAFRSNSSQDNHWWDRCPRIWTISCHRPFNWKPPLLLRFLNLAPSLVSFFSKFFKIFYLYDNHAIFTGSAEHKYMSDQAMIIQLPKHF